MAAEAVFVKKLTITDVNNRLAFPTAKLGILPAVADERDPVEFPVWCGNQVYTFRCTKSNVGALRPVIERGWAEMVRAKGLLPGDILEFYMREPNQEEEDHHLLLHPDQQPPRYWIEVRRCIWYCQDEMGTTVFWQRIV